MTTFDNREKGMEGSYAHRENVNFTVEARCCKIYGLWVAEKLGLEGDEAEIYAKSVVESNLEEAGFDDVLRKVRGDLDSKKIEISEHDLNSALDDALAEARRQILGDQI